MVLSIFIRILIEHLVSKQWISRSDAAFCGAGSGSALFDYVPQKRRDMHCLHMSHKKDARLIWIKLMGKKMNTILCSKRVLIWTNGIATKCVLVCVVNGRKYYIILIRTISTWRF